MLRGTGAAETPTFEYGTTVGFRPSDPAATSAAGTLR
jgi:hypothetical protein